jgi:hypothetical protein
MGRHAEWREAAVAIAIVTNQAILQKLNPTTVRARAVLACVRAAIQRIGINLEQIIE